MPLISHPQLSLHHLFFPTLFYLFPPSVSVFSSRRGFVEGARERSAAPSTKSRSLRSVVHLLAFAVRSHVVVVVRVRLVEQEERRKTNDEAEPVCAETDNALQQ